MSIKVLVVGAGAIGGFYGALLARQGAEVSVVCRSDYQYVKQQGFLINSRKLGNWQFRPQQVLQHAREYQGQADFILLCTKILQEIDQAALIRDAVHAQTAIVFIQNGVEIEQPLRDAFPENELISGLAFICCNRTQPGMISHLAYGRLALGNLPEAISDNTRLLSKLFEQAGITCHASGQISTLRWQKCIWNAPFNPLSVLSNGLLTKDILQSREAFVRHIMEEIVAIALASGHALPENIIDKNITDTYLMPPYKTSMLLDYEAGQAMETEAILGNAWRAGKRLQVDCPYLESVYAMMKLKELQIKQSGNL